MASIRETRDTFKILLSELRTVKEGLNAESNAISNAKSAARHSARTAIDAIVPNTDDNFMAWLDEVSDKTNTGRNFTFLVSGLRGKDEETTANIAELQSRYTSPAADAEKVKSLRADETEDETTLAQTRADKRKITKAREQVDLHNKNFSNQLNAETAGQYKSRSLWKSLTDSEYRSAFNAYQNYKPVHGSFEKDITELVALSASITTQEDRISGRRGAISILNDQISAMNNLERQIDTQKLKFNGPEKILETVRATVMDLAENKPAFAALLAEESGLELAGPLTVALLKIKNLRRAETGVDAHLAGVNKSIGKLDAPMSKLNRGINNGGGSQTLRGLDLKKIKTSINDQLGGAKTATANASGFRHTVSDFSPTYQSNNDFGFFQNLLLIQLLTHNNDHTYCHQTMGVRENSIPTTLDGLNELKENTLKDTFNAVDGSGIPEIATPDLGTSIPDIDSGNIQVEVPNVDVDVKVDVPEIKVDVPEITVNVPDIVVDVPTIDVPSVNFDSTPSWSPDP